VQKTKYQKVLAVIILIIVTLSVYWQVQGHMFVGFDDQLYITENRHVQVGINRDSLLWAFTNSYTGHWHPITWLSHMVDFQLYRFNAAGHLWTNVILHLLNALLLLTVLSRMTGSFWRSYAVAVLFALHPLNVESVAWVSERKNVLSTMFWFLATYAYLLYVARPSIPRYIAVIILFAFGLMTKPMLVTLPFVFLLIDYWPLGRWSKLSAPPWHIIKEKLPLVALSFVSSVITIKSSIYINTLDGFTSMGLQVRLSNAILSYGAYIGKMFWPHDLAVFYPYQETLPLLLLFPIAAMLAAITACVLVGGKKAPYLVTGWFWYVGTLVPVIGLVQVGKQAMADRYAYIPLIGLFIMSVWGLTDIVLTRYPSWRYKLTALFIVVAVAFSVAGFQQVRVWQDSFTLFRHALRKTENNPYAHHGLGMAYYAQGDRRNALKHLQAALELRKDEETLNDMGIVLISLGDFSGAERELRTAMKYGPKYPKVNNNLGVALASQGKYQEAIEQFKIALHREPDYENAAHNLEKAMKSWILEGRNLREMP